VHGSNARNLSVQLSLPQTSKNTVFLIISCFLINKIGDFVLQNRGWEGGEGRREEVAQTMYTHVSKCKNDKTKEKN
jgi:hypothetical protein